MRCLLIDNYDSFTYNLADYIGETFGEQPTVVYNDQYSWTELRQRVDFDCIVVSPGPGTVTKQADFHASREAIAQNEIPVFGVCLGFQGIAHQHGGQILHCPTPYHGRTSNIIHQNDPMFADIPNPCEVIRYHSLMADISTSTELIETARTSCGITMGLRHKSLPKWGVQFHPESILTQHGHQMMTNFRNLAHQQRKKSQFQVNLELKPAPVETNRGSKARPKTIKQLHYKKVASAYSAKAIFSALFASQAHNFWLDNQSADSKISRFSYMGSVDADQVLRYQISEDDQDLTQGHAKLQQIDQLLGSTELQGTQDLPFNFIGGLIGYFSYEMKALFGGDKSFENSIPDMIWMHVDRFVVFDHQQQQVYLVANSTSQQMAADLQWIAELAQQLRDLPSGVIQQKPQPKSQLELTMDADHQQYLDTIKQCQAQIIEGNSYEVCLTNHFSLDVDIDPYQLYLDMRNGNAAPFGAFIKSHDLAVLSTSPERFLKVSADGQVQAKPIKGTSKRSTMADEDQQLAQQLANSEKDRAENAMIVDLMRSDLNRVSKPNSVEVPVLMGIESYKTVHQMVSTISSQLRDDQSLLDLIKVTFPGGSITGAPKLRTMEIIDQLEKSARGVYCGAMGYLGYNRVADLNIGIRTLVYDGQQIRFGAGGAITYLSDPQAEFDEIMLKAEALIKPLWQFFAGDNNQMKTTIDQNKVLLAKE